MLDSIVFYSKNHINNKITIYNDTLMSINTSNNNLYFLKDDEQCHYLFLTNEALLEVELQQDNIVFFDGENANFSSFLNDFYNLYSNQMNLLSSEKLLSDEFEIKLYKLINEDIFNFYKNHQFSNSMTSFQKEYFKDLLTFKYLNRISNYLIHQNRDTLQGLPFYTDVNINLLNWDMLIDNMNNDMYYELDIYQNYIFNSLILFALNKYKYIEKSTFHKFNNYLFSFVLEHLPHQLIIPFFRNYLVKYSKFLDNIILKSVENFLKNTNISKSEMNILLAYVKLNDNTLDKKSEKKINHQFYLEDINGHSASLNDFVGKVLYVDLWASWCGPCRSQFPYAQQLKSKLSKRQLKKIKFIYISIDNDYDKWKASVDQLSIGGFHFISPANKENSAGQYFSVSSIPRYIIINQEGIVVQENAKRPSDDSLLDDLIRLIK
tara:strand:- start:200 stop:1504 length:1305 start_codon:yes stop_codon:yes gene_type:complete